jgi:hypothetical protein
MPANSTRHCETLQIAGLNTFAVKFIRLGEDTRSRIGRALDRQSDSAGGGRENGHRGGGQR